MLTTVSVGSENQCFTCYKMIWKLTLFCGQEEFKGHCNVLSFKGLVEFPSEFIKPPIS